MIVGPYEAVRVWATRRFDLVEVHVLDYPLRGPDGPGWGVHSERFLSHTLLPAAIAAAEAAKRDGDDGDGERRRLALDRDPAVCFLRARADGSVWTRDCAQSPLYEDCDLGPAVVDLVEGYHNDDDVEAVSCDDDFGAAAVWGSLRCRWRSDERRDEDEDGDAGEEG